MIQIEPMEIWFVTGSQHLYGEDALKQVAADSAKIVEGLNASGRLVLPIIAKPLATTPAEIVALAREASADTKCAGLICWMHTFSPAKMWIGGLNTLAKPFLHLHTQYNRDIPWSTIDMDFMNLNQSAHGGREFGHIVSRMRIERKVVVGHWQDQRVQDGIDTWMRAAAAWHDAQGLKLARFGDNMREVAVTEGDKVEAQIRFGYSVNGFGLGDLVAHYEAAEASAVDRLVAEYESQYAMAPALAKGGTQRQSLLEAARTELAMRSFLEEGGFKAYIDTFENLHGLPQLPGIASQRLMADGYGFGAEGDWKTAALVRAMKVMDMGREGQTSFMEDYTYHFEPGRERCLGSHMLEVCPSIASGKPSCEIHPLSIGGKADPVRLVFDVGPGAGLNASIIDMGERFRMLVNTIEAVAPDAEMPKLPVARVVWIPEPDLPTAAAAWILAGGAHHTGFSKTVSLECLEDFSEMAGVELVVIDAHTRLRELKQELRQNDLYYRLARPGRP